MSEKLIKGIPKKEYMRNYMRNYNKRPEVKQKKEKKKTIEDVLDKIIEKQKKSRVIKKAKIIGVSRLDSKNRVTLGRRVLNATGVNCGEEVMFIEEGGHIQIVSREAIEIYYR